ncbi:MFS general substrate transporter [Fomes fomentarius]|nr:MFS general substrate transporter [Fomes fomentarius]
MTPIRQAHLVRDTTPAMPVVIDQKVGDDQTDEKNSVGLEEEPVVVDSYGSTSPLASGTERRAEEKRLVRKLDRRVLPVLCAMYLFSYLDKTNLGNARLQGLPRDVLHGDPTGVLFDWATSAYYFSYVLCQVPLILLLKLSSPRIWFGTMVIGWGLCTVLVSTAFNFPGLMVVRIGIGVFEAGLSPGFPFYLSLFYTREEIGLRTGCWHSFSAVSGAFSGLIAFGIQHAHTALANWKLLFIVEGIPTILLGICAMIILPSGPEDARIFDEKEREIAFGRRNRGRKGDVGRVINKAHVIAAFTDWKVYCAAVVHFAGDCATGTITAFLPTIIKTFGFTDALSQLLTIPPYIIAGIVLCLTCYTSDRLQSRGILAATACVVAGLGYMLLLSVSLNSVRYFATFLITMGAYTTVGLVLSWFSHNFGSETKTATGVALFNSLGHCGSILGSHLFPSKEGPRYVKGFAATGAVLFLGAIAALILTVSPTFSDKSHSRFL